MTLMMALLPVLKNTNSKSVQVIIGSHVCETSGITTVTETKLACRVILPGSVIHAKLAYEILQGSNNINIEITEREAFEK